MKYNKNTITMDVYTNKDIKTCSFSRGIYICTKKIIKKDQLMCVYHQLGNTMIKDNLFYSIQDKQFKSGKPDKFDYKYKNNRFYKYNGKKWKKCCTICTEYTSNDYCLKHTKNKKASSFSNISCECIDNISKLLQTDILHTCSHTNYKEKEYVIPGTAYKVDGWIPDTNIVFEFLGDFWHGNPVKYKQTDINKCNKKEYGQLYYKTFKRFQDIKNKGYIIYYIWEYEYRKLKKDHKLAIVEHIEHIIRIFK